MKYGSDVRRGCDSSDRTEVGLAGRAASENEDIAVIELYDLPHVGHDFFHNGAIVCVCVCACVCVCVCVCVYTHCGV